MELFSLVSRFSFPSSILNIALLKGIDFWNILWRHNYNPQMSRSCLFKSKKKKEGDLYFNYLIFFVVMLWWKLNICSSVSVTISVKRLSVEKVEATRRVLTTELGDCCRCVYMCVCVLFIYFMVTIICSKLTKYG